MKYIFNSILLIVICVFTLTRCTTNETTQQTETEAYNHAGNNIALTAAQIKTAGITTGTVQRKHISGVIKANGMLDVPPNQMISISVPFGGFVKNTTMLQGTRVKKGMVIATIENPEFIQLQQDYVEAISQLEFAQADYERQQALAKENVNAQKTVQQAKSTYQSLLARKNGLLAKLKMANLNAAQAEAGTLVSTANVYAPIDGYVTEVNVNVGKYVSPTDVLFEIVDTEHLHAELTIFEKDVMHVKVGQKVLFTLANENNVRTASVYLIGREIKADRTIRIHCHIDEEDTEMLPGMYLKASIETSGGTPVIALPEDAVVDFIGKKFIFVPVPNKSETEQVFQLTEIKTGNTEASFTEIILPNSITETTPVVTHGAYAILSALKNSNEDEHGH